MPEPKSPFKRVRREFTQRDLKRICEMHETDFEEAYGLDKYIIQQRGDKDDNFYLFKDNGSNILAVAHLDTVIDHARRTASFVNTEGGPVVFSGALDDRLGAYTILELMPRLGLTFDILLTTGEESGRSTAEFFEPPEGKEYHWMIEFDRGGTDVVMYQYDDREMRDLVRKCGARPNDGIFSDISYLEHLEIKGFNWGVGYRDYHGVRGHAWLEDYWMMMAYFVKFHAANADTYLPHEKNSPDWWGRGSRGGGSNLWGGGEYYYKSERGEAWWDGDEPTASKDDEEEEKVPWYKDETCWTEEHWDAYLDGGEDAVFALGPPEGYEDEMMIITMDGDDPFPDVPGELVTDDFIAVNRALTAGGSTQED